MSQILKKYKAVIDEQEKAIRRNCLTQAVINSLLQFSLENISLNDFLKVALNVILASPTLVSNSMAAIYLIDDDSKTLSLKAENGLPEFMKTIPRTIGLNKLNLKSPLSVEEAGVINRAKGFLRAKGKPQQVYTTYYLPILRSTSILGLFAVYLKGKQKPDTKDKDFLGAVVTTLALAIKRKKIEQGRIKSNKELKKAYQELRKTQYDLVQSEKLVALGMFSSGLAHEVKNPLGIILGGVEFLEKKLQSTGGREAKIAIKKIKESTLRADAVISNLLSFSMPSEAKKERLNPKELINDSLSLLEYRISLTKINVTKKFSKQDVYVKIDRNQFQQVLFNVLTNAIEALSKGGRIIVAISKKCQEEFFNNKPACLIEISDNGEGISRSNLLKLFKPFFTTKRKKKGTGLGLAISQTIIKNYRGLLTVESEAKKGTKVTIILPAA